MPLNVYQRDSSGEILYAKNEEGLDVAVSHPVELTHEMTVGDFEHGPFSWLYLTFDENSLWVDETPECLNMLGNLAAFLNEKTVGPYYVHEGFHNTRSTYGIVLLDERDVKAFAEEFPDWKFDEKSHALNIGAIQAGIQVRGWTPESPRMQKFCRENGWNGGSSAAPVFAPKAP